MSSSSTPAAPATPLGLSHDRTSTRVLRLVTEGEGFDWRVARIGDVGAGRGRFSSLVADELRRRGRHPEEGIFPVDLLPETFEVEDLRCHRIPSDGRLPFPDGFLHATVSIEVIEHVQDPFAFLRELYRVTRPGGRVVVTTPNVLHMTSRLRNLVWGFPTLFDPLPLTDADVRFLSGHIQPISPYFLGYAAQKAGLEQLELTTDRHKHSAVAWTLLLAPVLAGARLLNRRRLARKRPGVWEENRTLIEGQSRWDLLTGRTTILTGIRPSAARASGDVLVPSAPPSLAGTLRAADRSSPGRSRRESSGAPPGR